MEILRGIPLRMTGAVKWPKQLSFARRSREIGLRELRDQDSNRAEEQAAEDWNTNPIPNVKGFVRQHRQAGNNERPDPDGQPDTCFSNLSFDCAPNWSSDRSGCLIDAVPDQGKPALAEKVARLGAAAKSIRHLDHQALIVDPQQVAEAR